jgi:hypothetical protein
MDAHVGTEHNCLTGENVAIIHVTALHRKLYSNADSIILAKMNTIISLK